MFDTLLYPILSNTAVFAFSVLVTYMTNYGRQGNLFKRRGDWTRAKMQQWFKMTPQAAKEAIMIAFSFLDGCFMAPVIKWAENHKIEISHWLDRKLGSSPEDQRAYEREPKQSWSSVLAGRAAALAVVLPMYKLLSRKFNGKLLIQKLERSWPGLQKRFPKLSSFLNNHLDGQNTVNQLIFEKPGHLLSKPLKKKWPGLQKRFPSLNIPGLIEVCLLEGFYTTLCTAGLYISSRLFTTRLFPWLREKLDW